MPKPSETSFLNQLAEAFPIGTAKPNEANPTGNSEVIGIGDDCAYLGKNRFLQGIVLGQDMIAEGVHFDLKDAKIRDIAFKSIAVNMSDAYSMGAVGEYVVASVMIPRTFSSAECQSLLNGFKDASEELGVQVIGGDTNFWNNGLVICVCILGDLISQKPILQSGMSAGDVLLLSGPIGNSYDSGMHLRPKFLAPSTLRKLFEEMPINSMTDISDGLPKDLIQMAEKSNCGVNLNAAKIPILIKVGDEFVEGFYNPETAPLDFLKLISEGEDFQLCLSVSEQTWNAIQNCKELQSSFHEIGRATNQPQVYEIQFPQETMELPNLGFSH